MEIQCIKLAEPGYAFFLYPPGENATGRTVFVIHGWSDRGRNLMRLSLALAKAGYRVFCFDYPTFRFHIDRHADIFLDGWRNVVSGLPSDERLFVVTHSMGGIVLRATLNKMRPEERARIKAAVMLGPPNRGSLWAVPGNNRLVELFNPSLGDMSTARDSYVNTLEVGWLPPLGIVAGKYDLLVRYRDTSLPGTEHIEKILVNCTHLGLRYPENVLEPVLAFLENESFRPTQDYSADSSTV